MTLYADLLQRAQSGPARSGSISVKSVGGRKFLYAVQTALDGSARTQRYLGPEDDPEAVALADNIRRRGAEARERRAIVSGLKRMGLQGPPLDLGRILHAVDDAGLFADGLILIGTAAYRLYPLILGYHLGSEAMTTQDADFSVAAFMGRETIDFEAVLKTADPTFNARMSNTDRAPKAFRNASGFTVELLTKYGRNRNSPVAVPKLTAAAEALSYQEYLASDTMETVALHGPGALVRVPTPMRYAIHKLIVAQMRGRLNPKHRKDLLQASKLLTILRGIDPDQFDDDISAARRRGRKWREAIDASLKMISSETN